MAVASSTDLVDVYVLQTDQTMAAVANVAIGNYKTDDTHSTRSRLCEFCMCRSLSHRCCLPRAQRLTD